MGITRRDYLKASLGTLAASAVISTLAFAGSGYNSALNRVRNHTESKERASANELEVRLFAGEIYQATLNLMPTHQRLYGEALAGYAFGDFGASITLADRSEMERVTAGGLAGFISGSLWGNEVGKGRAITDSEKFKEYGLYEYFVNDFLEGKIELSRSAHIAVGACSAVTVGAYHPGFGFGAGLGTVIDSKRKEENRKRMQLALNLGDTVQDLINNKRHETYISNYLRSVVPVTIAQP